MKLGLYSSHVMPLVVKRIFAFAYVHFEPQPGRVFGLQQFLSYLNRSFFKCVLAFFNAVKFFSLYAFLVAE